MKIMTSLLATAVAATVLASPAFGQPGQGRRCGQGPGNGNRNFRNGGCLNAGNAGAWRQGPRAGFQRGRGPGRGFRQDTCPALSLVDRQTTAEVPAAYLDRLQAALDHELDARDFYRQAAGRTGFRRFSNFARAEQNHADRISDAIRFLGGTPAPRPQAARPGSAGSSAAPQHGRELESAAISIYEDLIRDCPDPDLKPVLQNIQAANRRHLVASGG